MRKLLLIAAMLMVPALAMADTDVTWSEVVVDTSMENFAYGPIHMQNPDGHDWGNWAGGVNIIDDPTLSGRGKVAAWQIGGTSRLYVDRRDYDWVITHSDGGKVTWESDLWVSGAGIPGNVVWLQNGVPSDIYLDGGVITPGNTIEGFMDGPLWDPYDPTISTVTMAPLPTDTWFRLGIVADFSKGAWSPDGVEVFLDGVSLGTCRFDWPEDNSLQWDYGMAIQNLFPGDNYMLLDRVYWAYEAVPEPSVLALGGLGLLALLRRRKK